MSLQIYRALVHLHLGDSLTAGREGRGGAPRLPGFGSDLRTLPEARARVAARHVHACEPAARVECRRPSAARRRAGVRRTRRCDIGEDPPADAPSARAVPRGSFGDGVDLCGAAAQPRAAAGRPEQALSWLRKAADAWHAAQSDPAFAAPHRREMREVEEALARIERR